MTDEQLRALTRAERDRIDILNSPHRLHDCEPFPTGCAVRCIKTLRPAREYDLDFGTEGLDYLVAGYLPDYDYLVLEGMGQPGDPNYYVNASRFRRLP